MFQVMPDIYLFSSLLRSERKPETLIPSTVGLREILFPVGPCFQRFGPVGTKDDLSTVGCPGSKSFLHGIHIFSGRNFNFGPTVEAIVMEWFPLFGVTKSYTVEHLLDHLDLRDV